MNWPLETRRRTVTTCRAGRPYPETAEKLGVPRGTVSYWAHVDRLRRGEPSPLRPSACPKCDGLPLDHAAYSYLLGLYLGDGHIVSKPKQQHLSLYCCNGWPGLMDEAEAAMLAVLPGYGTGRREDRLHRGQVLHQALDLPLPPARSGHETHPPDHPGALAAGDRDRAPLAADPRPDPLRRLPRHQLGHRKARRRHDKTVRVPPLHLHQQVRRHPRHLQRRAGHGRDPLANEPPRRRPVSTCPSPARRPSHSWTSMSGRSTELAPSKRKAVPACTTEPPGCRPWPCTPLA